MVKEVTTKAGSKRTASKSKGTRKRTSASAETKKVVGKLGKAKALGRKVVSHTATAAKRSTAKSIRSGGAVAKTAKKRVKKKVTARKAAKRTSGSKRTSRTTEPPATSQDQIQLPEETRPLPKTYLTDNDLQKFTELLLRKRAELAGDIDRLTREALNTKGAGHGEHSAMPIHMADLGSDNWEQEFTLGLIANERALVREIDEALDRIEKKTYGICIATGKRITKARLRAKPWAEYCIEYARAREEGRAP